MFPPSGDATLLMPPSEEVGELTLIEMLGILYEMLHQDGWLLVVLGFGFDRQEISGRIKIWRLRYFSHPLKPRFQRHNENEVVEQYFLVIHVP